MKWDHPRTCGEKRFNRDQTILTTGSPPHMRGKDAFISPYGDIPGITPAHAGKRIGFSAFSGLSGDHPRTCGEKSLMRSLHTGRLGSPPHMRGKVGHCLASNSILGITPAHAGKRLKRSRSIVSHAAIVPLFPSVCNKPAGSDGSPAGHDAPPFLPIENAAPASPAYNLRSL